MNFPYTDFPPVTWQQLHAQDLEALPHKETLPHRDSPSYEEESLDPARGVVAKLQVKTLHAGNETLETLPHMRKGLQTFHPTWPHDHSVDYANWILPEFEGVT